MPVQKRFQAADQRTQQISFRLTTANLRALQRLARSSAIPISSLVRNAINLYLNSSENPS
jgi:predicted DNA-binding protein